MKIYQTHHWLMKVTGEFSQGKISKMIDKGQVESIQEMLPESIDRIIKNTRVIAQNITAKELPGKIILNHGDGVLIAKAAGYCPQAVDLVIKGQRSNLDICLTITAYQIAKLGEIHRLRMAWVKSQRANK